MPRPLPNITLATRFVNYINPEEGRHRNLAVCWTPGLARVLSVCSAHPPSSLEPAKKLYKICPKHHRHKNYRGIGSYKSDCFLGQSQLSKHDSQFSTKKITCFSLWNKTPGAGVTGTLPWNRCPDSSCGFLNAFRVSLDKKCPNTWWKVVSATCSTEHWRWTLVFKKWYPCWIQILFLSSCQVVGGHLLRARWNVTRTERVHPFDGCNKLRRL